MGKRAGQRAVWVATVGGVGRLPWAPGTWGSMVGLAIGYALLWSVPWPVAYAAAAVLCAVAIMLCGPAERALGGRDPSAIVLDEVCGMLVVVLALPWAAQSWGGCLGMFLAFRAFDIMKLPPLGWLERRPGGWGVVGDDLGAAAQAILVLTLVRPLLP